MALFPSTLHNRVPLPPPRDIAVTNGFALQGDSKSPAPPFVLLEHQWDAWSDGVPCLCIPHQGLSHSPCLEITLPVFKAPSKVTRVVPNPCLCRFFPIGIQSAFVPLKCPRDVVG
eukprot:164120-Ditylum_brightwellii.AAC.1